MQALHDDEHDEQNDGRDEKRDHAAFVPALGLGAGEAVDERDQARR